MIRDPEDIAIRFVETTTEFDFDELPEPVRDALREAAAVFAAYAYPEVVVVNERPKTQWEVAP
ncbi:hypothetical protein PTQ19_10190 [Microbacterium esteraromaticum]|uniref:hypothetical protein n=1 Tax=Microbacterium esteraromaticum TaxID=57043 RepID=UPI002367B7AB|nr:hypothetical protein [Microbacterium esteraromaticum]WDH77890.1 hypothetical protein PTQ19_10190 [Microbacterium esteraromaticum]